jgi:hypothetical protein
MTDETHDADRELEEQAKIADSLTGSEGDDPDAAAAAEGEESGAEEPV